MYGSISVPDNLMQLQSSNPGKSSPKVLLFLETRFDLRLDQRRLLVSKYVAQINFSLCLTYRPLFSLVNVNNLLPTVFS